MEHQLVLEGGLMVCDLGGLRPGGNGQTLEIGRASCRERVSWYV